MQKVHSGINQGRMKGYIDFFLDVTRDLEHADKSAFPYAQTAHHIFCGIYCEGLETYENAKDRLESLDLWKLPSTNIELRDYLIRRFGGVDAESTAGK